LSPASYTVPVNLHLTSYQLEPNIPPQAKLTDSMRKRAADQMVIDKKKRAGGASDDNAKVRMEATVRASIPHPALLVPMTRSRGVRPARYCPPCHPPHFRLLLFELNGVT